MIDQFEPVFEYIVVIPEAQILANSFFEQRDSFLTYCAWVWTFWFHYQHLYKLSYLHTILGHNEEPNFLGEIREVFVWVQSFKIKYSNLIN